MSAKVLQRHRRAAVEAARIAGGMVDAWVASGVPGDLRARFCETRCAEVERVAQLAADVELNELARCVHVALEGGGTVQAICGMLGVPYDNDDGEQDSEVHHFYWSRPSIEQVREFALERWK